jgi:hypothetical protein
VGHWWVGDEIDVVVVVTELLEGEAGVEGRVDSRRVDMRRWEAFEDVEEVEDLRERMIKDEEDSESRRRWRRSKCEEEAS